jgi:hypothetical protein
VPHAKQAVGNSRGFVPLEPMSVQAILAQKKEQETDFWAFQK